MRDARAGRLTQSPFVRATTGFTQPTVLIVKPKRECWIALTATSNLHGSERKSNARSSSRLPRDAQSTAPSSSKSTFVRRCVGNDRCRANFPVSIEHETPLREHRLSRAITNGITLDVHCDAIPHRSFSIANDGPNVDRLGYSSYQGKRGRVFLVESLSRQTIGRRVELLMAFHLRTDCSSTKLSAWKQALRRRGNPEEESALPVEISG
jgi:hypothetical protein